MAGRPRHGRVGDRPGAALVELAVRAGDETGCGRVDELVLESPLVIPEHGGVHVQVVVGALEDDRRTLAVYSRPDDGTDQPWTRHADGALAVAPPPAAFQLAPWPRPRPSS
ncbi:hypothetical protein NKH77_11740 [Streptomyces sp. M19]